jgi:hypothetical protein
MNFLRQVYGIVDNARSRWFINRIANGVLKRVLHGYMVGSSAPVLPAERHIALER